MPLHEEEEGGKGAEPRRVLTLSGECRGPARDSDVPSSRILGCGSTIIPPESQECELEPKTDSSFLFKNGVVRKLSNGIHHRGALGELSYFRPPFHPAKRSDILL